MGHETKIRDFLAANLDMLEDGLTLIEKEHYLPNDKGAAGFVDIFCRDKQARLLIIEIKRSDSAARSAIHELQKYVALLKTNRLLIDSEIRVAVLSTTWHELLLPFSEYQQICPVECEGYQIHALATGEIESIDKVEGSQISQTRKICRRQYIWEFQDPSRAKAAIDTISTALRGAGLEDFVLLIVKLSRPIDGISVLIYFAQQEHSFDYYFALIKQNLPETEVSEFLEWIEDLSEESDRIGEAADRCWDGQIPFGTLRPDGQQISHPEKARQWLVSDMADEIDIFRYGKFDDPHLENGTIVSEICGTGGTSTHHIDFRAAPFSKTKATELKAAIEEAFYSNDAWRSQLIGLVEYASKNKYEKVEVRAFNNDNILQTVAGLALGNIGIVPYFIAVIAKNDEELCFAGCLEWNGDTPDFDEIVQKFFDGDATNILFHEHFGANREINDEILSMMGLDYVVVLAQPDAEDVKIKFRGMSLVRLPSSTEKTLPDFMKDAGEFVGDVTEFYIQHHTAFASFAKQAMTKLHRDCELDMIGELSQEEKSSRKDKWLGHLETCDLCGRPFDECEVMVDGAIEAPQSPWANMCATCFKEVGQGIGPGSGQLYLRAEGKWWRVR